MSILSNWSFQPANIYCLAYKYVWQHLFAASGVKLSGAQLSRCDFKQYRQILSMSTVSLLEFISIYYIMSIDQEQLLQLSLSNSESKHISRQQSKIMKKLISLDLQEKKENIQKTVSNQFVTQAMLKPQFKSPHERLYRQYRKIQTRKALEQVIDNELKKQMFPFKPQIGQQSQKLAKNRKHKQKLNTSIRFSGKNNQIKEAYIDLTQTQLKNLHKLFFMLSSNTISLRKQTLQIEFLPQECFNSLRNIIQKVSIRNIELSWIEFLQDFQFNATNKKECLIRLQQLLID